MTTTRTRSDIGRSNRRRGADAERRVAGYLRDHGFPHAERAVRTGYSTDERTVADPGDLTGTPGLVWQVKDTQRWDVPKWMTETTRQAEEANADLGILVIRRRGQATAGLWWALLPLADLGYLYGGRNMLGFRNRTAPVWLQLDALCPLLLAAGYGEWA
ncbi:hypothetical protein SAMN04487905_10641 [Actinopolyspora xinjiangensis]|uniref:Uncharacterized protein n=1 Tax=Actinopolyspora xinjiangensis TaxID=405564 RepID=A0A1H0U4H8_9ACTN|nr:hypothetical protein [Actinopolyspora xinjiangensis]SDP61041.1 hypothetical protein SAMN04487905_10641 [Actinopolyspora xinjiangensis]